MRAQAGDERESATVTAARQLAEEARENWWVPRTPAREWHGPRAVSVKTARRRLPEPPARPEQD
jgi:hypothetical protein